MKKIWFNWILNWLVSLSNSLVGFDLLSWKNFVFKKWEILKFEILNKEFYIFVWNFICGYLLEYFVNWINKYYWYMGWDCISCVVIVLGLNVWVVVC